MWRTYKIVASVHTWQCDVLPSSPSPISGISPHAISPQLTTPCCSSPISPKQTPVYDAPLPVSMCSHCSKPTYEWDYAVFDFLFLCQFAENDGFKVYPCPYKGHELIVFDGCIVFHGVYVPHFPCPVYHRWAFGLVPGLCYCTQGCNEHSCACILIVEWFIILWIYTQ